MESPNMSTHGGIDAAAQRRAEAITDGVTVDIGGVPTLLHASDRRRADAMAAMLVGLPDHVGPKTVAVLMTSEPPRMPLRPPDETFDDLAAWQSGTEFALRSASGLSVLADHTRAHIGGDALHLIPAFRTVFPAAITHLLAHHDRFVLHAGAIATDDSAFLVLGPTGTGKSTLVLAALHAGWKALSDDLVVLRPDQGHLSVTGIPRPITVPADVVGIGPPGSRTLSDDARNRVELPLDRLQPGWWPVAGLLVTGLGSGPEGSIRALDGATVLSKVVAAFLAAPNLTLLHHFFGRAASLSRLPAWELEHGRDGSARVEAAGRLLDTVRRPGLSPSPESRGRRDGGGCQ